MEQVETPVQANLDHFLVVGNMAWGKDRSLHVALTNWIKQARPKTDTTIHIRQVTKDAYIDGMGTLYSADMVKLPDVIVPEWLIRKMEDVSLDIADLMEPVRDAVAYDRMVSDVEDE